MEKCNNCQNPSACFPDDCKVMPIYKPTPASTVLTVEQWITWAEKHPAGYNCRGGRGIERYFEEQDTYTRQKIAEALVEIKGELFAADINEEDYYEIAADKLDALIKRLEGK